MLDKIHNFFQTRLATKESSDKNESADRIPLATCALLLEMAYADSEFSDMEEKKITAILKQEFSLSENDAEELIKLSNLERKQSLDLWQFTNLINHSYTKEEKQKVLETLWRVIYADGKVDKYEEYLMRRLSNLLNMDHRDMIEAKFKARGKHSDIL